MILIALAFGVLLIIQMAEGYANRPLTFDRDMLVCRQRPWASAQQ